MAAAYKTPGVYVEEISTLPPSVGPAANAAKYLAGEAGFQACEQAVMTHGGFGYAKEYHVERYLRESLIPRIAPISPQLVLSFIAEKVLGMPKSY
jgi:acyl-CoA dehydrogenase